MQQANRCCPARKRPDGEFAEFLNDDPQLVAVVSFREICKQVATPYATRALRALDAGSFREFLLRGFETDAYHNWHIFAQDYLVYNYLRKYEGMRPLVDLKVKALDKFHQVEHVCAAFNKKFTFDSEYSRTVSPLLMVAARKISEVLGEFSYEAVLRDCEWSGGATSSIPRKNSNLPNKMMEGNISVTPALLDVCKYVIGNDPVWQESRIAACCLDDFRQDPASYAPFCVIDTGVNVSMYGKFTTVPKDWNNLRAIETQPTFNMFVQKGSGQFIRKQLRKHGIDLNDQTKNQRKAKRAAYDGLATLDLSNASDSICRELVRQLLGESWYNWLDKCRTHAVRLPDGTVCPLHRFSAMGNGFTFELESLIFYAISYAAVQLNGGKDSSAVSVYGDDIIVEQKHSLAVIEALQSCGFTVNTDKSYTSGLFYESCGSQYFDGWDVTPIFQKEIVYRCHISTLRCANRLIDVGLRLGGQCCISTIIKPAWDFISFGGLNYESRNFCRKYEGPLHGDGSGYWRNPGFRPLADRDGIFHTTTLIERYKQERVFGRKAKALYANFLRSRTRGGLLPHQQLLPADGVPSDSDRVPTLEYEVSDGKRRWYCSPSVHTLPSRFGQYVVKQSMTAGA